MLPGPTTIYQCPGCDNKLSMGSLMSGNTFGAEQYSDGKRIAPMMPEFPSITKCSKCKTIFWISDAKKLATVDEWGESRIRKKIETAEEARFLTLMEFYEALEKGLGAEKSNEFFLRQWLWWAYNDRTRGRKRMFESDFEERLWHVNLTYLSKLLSASDGSCHDDPRYDQLMLAEVHRHLGNFSECRRIMANPELDEFDWVRVAYNAACDKEDTKVFRFK